ncbi:MAG: hypothetical protein JWS10_239 [Cypionkella sp.]|nr:hypothetical protein [Cypionkella sp.]
MVSGSRVTWLSVTLLGLGFMALLLIVGVTFNLAERSQSQFDTSLSTQELSAAAVELRYGLQAAESAQRGYIASGNEIYLAPYGTAKALALRKLQKLTTLLEPGQRDGAATQRLVMLINSKIEEMDTTIALKRERKDEEALSVFRSNRGKAIMDEANVFIASMIRNANARLTENVDAQKNGLFRLRRIILTSAVLIVVVVTSTYVMIVGVVRYLRRARDVTAALNSDLETRVKNRTAELSAARDRAEILLLEVNHRVSNSLALVAAMVGMQSRATTSTDTQEALAEAQTRINAVALVHKELYVSGEVQSVALDGFLSSLLRQLEISMRDAGHQASLKQTIAALSLPTDKSVSLGIITSEWVTNAFKYAYPSGGGEIRVTLKRIGDGPAELLVEDDGVGRKLDQRPQGTGLGTKLVKAMASTLGGSIEYSERRPGTTAKLTLPIT